jgi:hypothetical protein
MELLSATMLGETPATIVSLVLCALAVTALWRLRRVTAGTTLVAPWCWAFAAVAAMTCAAVAAARDASSAATYRYLAGAMLLAPPMALLGAKRPQDRAWQWIVASLLLLAAIPVGQQWLYRPGGMLQVEPAWQWFLLVIATFSVINHLPTAHCVSALLYGVALHALLGEQFPAWLRAPYGEAELVALSCIAVAAWLAGRKRQNAKRSLFDRQWLDFRDAYGATWALRVMERFNASARTGDWGVHLTWSGFVNAEATPAELPEAAEQSWRNLMRRFLATNQREPEA